MKNPVLNAKLREERQRARRHQSIFAAIPEHPAKQALRVAMLEAAFWLFDDSKNEAGDGLLEFMSDADAAEVCRQFFETEDVFDPSAFAAPPYVFIVGAPTPGFNSARVRRPDWRKRARWQTRARLVKEGKIE